MDELVRRIQSTEETVVGYRTLLSNLHEQQLENFPTATLQHALAELRMPQDTVGVVVLLNVMAQSEAVARDPRFLVVCAQKLKAADPVQVRVVHAELTALCRSITAAAIDTNKPATLVLPLRTLIRHCTPKKGCVTAVHACFVKLCVYAKHYVAAYDVIRHHAFQVESSSRAPEALDVLEYFFYAGMAFAALKRHDDAAEAFMACLSVPTIMLSKIMQEAYKALVLVKLAQDGAVAQPPLFLDPAMRRQISGLAAVVRTYMPFASAVQAGDVHNARQRAQEHFTQLNEDCNFGLAKRAIASLQRRKVAHLTHTYVTLSLADIAAKAQLDSPEQAERHVLSMVESGQVFATIDQSTGMVAFNEDPDSYDTMDTVARMHQEQLLPLVDLAERLRELGIAIATDPAAVKTRLQTERAAGAGVGAEFAEMVGGMLDQ